MNFSWNGEAIPDIEAWAAERGEEMVTVEHTWREPNILAGAITEKSELLRMPESFARSMRFGGPFDDRYEIVSDGQNE